MIAVKPRIPSRFFGKDAKTLATMAARLSTADVRAGTWLLGYIHRSGSSPFLYQEPYLISGSPGHFELFVMGRGQGWNPDQGVTWLILTDEPEVNEYGECAP